MLYKCKKCPKEFDKKTDYTRHINRKFSCNKLNKQNELEHFNCIYCEIKYNTKYDLYEHLKICPLMNDQLQLENTLLKQENKSLKTTIDNNKSELDFYKEQMDFYKQLIISSGVVLNNAVNSLAYTLKKYNNTKKLNYQ